MASKGKEIGDYTVLSKINEGAYGSVFLAKNSNTGETVCAKKIDISSLLSSEGEKAIAMIHNELKCLDIGKDHPNIVEFFGHECDEDDLWVFMEYCVFGDLQKYLTNRLVRPKDNQLMRIMEQAASAVEFLHEQTPPIVHRDIKLGNFLVQQGDDDEILTKLSDFGFAKLLPEGEDLSKFFMQTLAGTPVFMAPELLRGKGSLYDGSVDIFSLGLVFQVLLVYDGEDNHLIPASAASRKKDSRAFAYGQELVNCSPDLPAPPIFVPESSDTPLVTQLKEMITCMVKEKPSERLTAKQVLDYVQFTKAHFLPRKDSTVRSSSTTSPVSEQRSPFEKADSAELPSPTNEERVEVQPSKSPREDDTKADSEPEESSHPSSSDTQTTREESPAVTTVLVQREAEKQQPPQADSLTDEPKPIGIKGRINMFEDFQKQPQESYTNRRFGGKPAAKKVPPEGKALKKKVNEEEPRVADFDLEEKLRDAAGRLGDIERVKDIVKRKIRLNEPDDDGLCAIHLASKHGNIDIVKYFVQVGLSPATKDANGAQPLHYACKGGYMDLVVFLQVDADARVDAQDNNGNQPLHYACEAGHKDIVKFLLSRRAQVSAANKGGEEPIHHASKEGHVKIVKLLVKHGADPRAKDKNGMTPGRIAELSAHLQLTAWLTKILEDRQQLQMESVLFNFKKQSLAADNKFNNVF